VPSDLRNAIDRLGTVADFCDVCPTLPAKPARLYRRRLGQPSPLFKPLWGLAAPGDPDRAVEGRVVQNEK